MDKYYKSNGKKVSAFDMAEKLSDAKVQGYKEGKATAYNDCLLILASAYMNQYEMLDAYRKIEKLREAVE